jgi:hypothetical protein
MTRILLAAALVTTALLCALAARRRPPEPEPDDMAQAFLDSRNTATYLYNAATGVIVSAN